MGYVFLGLVSSMTVAFISKNSNQFLFYLYAMITNYIAVTIMVFYVLSTNSDSWVLGVYYFPISSIAFLVHLVKIKGQFDDK
jgi:uncharacterized protein (DUF983 family)